MRAVRFHETGGPEVLRIEDVAVRDPGRGEVLLRVDAVGLNRSEAYFRSGTYLEAPRLPAGLGSEAAGEILAVGPDAGPWPSATPSASCRAGRRTTTPCTVRPSRGTSARSPGRSRPAAPRRCFVRAGLRTAHRGPGTRMALDNLARYVEGRA